MLGLVFDAAVLGIIIVSVEGGEFPGWGPMIGVLLGMGLVSGGLSVLLPDVLWPLATLAGALAGAVLLGWILGMARGTALKAIGIYFGISVAFGFVLRLMIG